MFDIKVGYSCNNQCIHCVVDDKKSCRDLSTDEIVKCLQDYKDECIVFTGGEPTIRADFSFLVKTAKEINPNRGVFLQTNGRAFSDMNLVNNAIPYIDNVLIAIHSHNEYIHDMITQKANSFQETIHGLENVYSLFPYKITTQTVLTKMNSSNISKTYDFIQDKFPDIPKMNLTYPHYNGAAWRNYKRLSISYSEIKSEIIKIVSIYKSKIFIESIPQCIIYPYQDNVTYPPISTDKKGIDIANANNKYFGKDGIGDYSQSIPSEKIKIPTCAICKYNNDCEGVWKEYGMIYKNIMQRELIAIRG